jgi:palmitoyl-protein thioesterase
MCDLLMEQASRRAYTEWAQEHSFQANYWRDPRPVEKEAYQTFSQLAQWNNEGLVFNQTIKDNWSKTSKFVWVLALQDSMIWPKEGEHWGAPDPNDPFNHILRMNQTEWYQKDLFGLKTAQEAGKNAFETFDGDHLQFTMEDFHKWVETYLAMKDDNQVSISAE